MRRKNRMAHWARDAQIVVHNPLADDKDEVLRAAWRFVSTERIHRELAHDRAELKKPGYRSEQQIERQHRIAMMEKVLMLRCPPAEGGV